MVNNHGDNAKPCNMTLPLNQIVLGDALEVLRGWPDECVDAVVTDTPYGWKFMCRKWDYDVPSVELWQEVLRVMKPGAHLLSFCGTRTYHRMAVNIEDAGFEVRDVISWVYGSGFPKSLDISKALDKAAGAEREVVGIGLHAAHRQSQPYGQGATQEANKDLRLITAPTTEAARQWQGWHTALKPAMEMICLARKPLIGTVAENVLAHGCGGLNVDACRVAHNDPIKLTERTSTRYSGRTMANGKKGGIQSTIAGPSSQGRFPANLIHDGSDEVLALFPESNGSGKARKLSRSAKPAQVGWGMNKHAPDEVDLPDAGTGSAARFFYTAKASPSERGEGNSHPTVKPIDLIKYLIKLITPPGGIVLDPFGGSGTTAIAAHQLGKRWVLIEKDADYHAMAQDRIKRECAQLNMFHQLAQRENRK